MEEKGREVWQIMIISILRATAATFLRDNLLSSVTTETLWNGSSNFAVIIRCLEEDMPFSKETT